jgi:hypothetical protein
MAHIVCGHFAESVKADAALQALLAAGFTRNEVDTFYTPPPGQHNLTGFGGDMHSDAGARKAGGGAALGAAIGAALGALIVLLGIRAGIIPQSDFTPAFVLFGAALGAYVGSFMGAMVKMRHGSARNATPEHPIEAPAGRMIAVLIGAPDAEARIIELLRRHGARKVFRAEGTWRNGSWQDFDPRSPLAAV